MQPQDQQPQPTQPVQPTQQYVQPPSPVPTPEQTQQPYQQPIQQTAQTTYAPQPGQLPQQQPQQSAVPQPMAFTQQMSGMAAPTTTNIEKQRKLGLGLSILSIVIFVVALLFGYIVLLAAALGAYGVISGIRAKSKLLITLGSVGLGLNLIGYIFSAIYNLTN